MILTKDRIVDLHGSALTALPKDGRMVFNSEACAMAKELGEDHKAGCRSAQPQCPEALRLAQQLLRSALLRISIMYAIDQ